MTSFIPAHQTHQTDRQRAWRQALPVFMVLMALVLFLYKDTAYAIVSIWMRSDAFTHGFLVPPIVLWLIWRQRQVLAGLMPRPNVWAIVLLAGAAFAWLLGDLVAVNTLTQLAFVSIVVLLVPSVLGIGVTRAIIFPLTFLFFAVPFGEFAMPQLMIWTGDFTVLALRMTGIPVYREGLQFVIPSGNWSVVEACSGVRYLIASVTVGTLFAYLNYQSTRRRVLFIVVSFLVPILANWVRAYVIVLLGHFSGNTIATGVDHLIYGWVFFGVVIMLMFMVGARWSEPEASPLGSAFAPQSSEVVGAAAALAPANRVSSRWVLVWAAVAIAVATSWPMVARWQMDHATSAQAIQLVAPPSLAPAWVVSPDKVADWTPSFQNPSGQLEATYKNGTAEVGVYLGYYRHQDYNRKLVSSENVWVKSKDAVWAQVNRGTRTVQWAANTHIVRSGELRGTPVPSQLGDERLAVWQIYWVNGTLTSSDALAKAYGALYRLTGRGDDSAVVILYAKKGVAGEGEAALNAFVQANALAIDALLQGTRAQK